MVKPVTEALSINLIIFFRRFNISNTYINYHFPKGLAPDTVISIPFDYLDKDHVFIYADGLELSQNVDYSFDTKSSVRILKNIPNHCTLTVKRVTPPIQSHLYALEELRDEATIKDEIIKQLEENIMDELNLLLSEGLEPLEEKLTETQREAFTETSRLRADVDTLAEAMLRVDDKIIHITNKLSDIESRLDALGQDVFGQLSAFEKALSSLSSQLKSDVNGIKVQIDALGKGDDVLEEQLSLMKNTFQNVDNLKRSTDDCALEALKTAQSVETLEKCLKETRSALNTETQMRRREDAQIKALLKRLLGKYQRLESWVAAGDEDFSDNVIEELRQAIKTRDDILGRVHLENIVRINALKERLLSMEKLTTSNGD